MVGGYLMMLLLILCKTRMLLSYSLLLESVFQLRWSTLLDLMLLVRNCLLKLLLLLLLLL